MRETFELTVLAQITEVPALDSADFERFRLAWHLGHDGTSGGFVAVPHGLYMSIGPGNSGPFATADISRGKLLEVFTEEDWIEINDLAERGYGPLFNGDIARWLYPDGRPSMARFSRCLEASIVVVAG